MGRWVKGEGKARASFPKKSMATFSVMMPQAIVERSHAGEAARKNGRTASRSIAAPKTARQSSVAIQAGRSGQPSPTKNP